MRFIQILCIGLALILCGNLKANEPAEDPVLRLYDLSCFNKDVNLGEKPYVDEAWRTLLPFLSMYHPTNNKKEPNFVSLEDVVDMINVIMGEETFFKGGASIDLGQDSTLMVTAPPAAQKQIFKILGFLKSYFSCNFTLNVEVYTDKSNAMAAFNTPQEVRAAASKGIVQLIHQSAVTLPTCDLMEIDNRVEQSILWDFEPEIAQQSAIGEPILKPMALGLNLLLRPAITPDGKGCLIKYYAMWSYLTEPMQKREFDLIRAIATDKGLVEQSIADSLDNPKIGFACATSTLTQALGSSALIQCSSIFHGGFSGLNLIVTPQAAPPQRELGIKNNMILKGYDLSQYEIIDSKSPHIDRSRKDLRGWDSSKQDYENSCLAVSMGPRTTLRGYVSDHLIDNASNVAAGDWENIDSTHRWGFNGCVFVYAPAEYQQSFEKALMGLAMEKNRPVEAEVLFVKSKVLRNNTAEAVLSQGQVIGKTKVPMIKNGTAISAAGFEGTYVNGFDVDVATKASVSNPNLAAFLDGALVYLQHRAGMDSEGEIRAVIRLNSLQGAITPRALPKLGIVDQATFNQGFVENLFKTDNKFHILGHMAISDGETIYIMGRAK